MPHNKEIVTAVGTLAIAIGIGFVMQRSEAAQEYYGKPAQSDIVEPQDVTTSSKDGESDPVLNSAASADILLQVQDVVLTSASDPKQLPAFSEITDPRRTSVPTGDLSQTEDDQLLAENCEVSAQATALPGALVNISLDASCAPNERLTVHHNGMIFTETTDDAGRLTFSVPALAEEAVFILAFSSGDGAVTQVNVPDIADFDRTVLQWRGQSGFELHALEFGAGYGDSGHVWSGADQNIAGLLSGENGVIFRLGDSLSVEPLMAEVYTYPSAKSARAGIVDLSIEAEITSTNCGLEIEAKSLEKLASGQIETHDLTLSVPDCDAIGSFLVLNNLVTDLKVASN